jgi:glucosamine--fructose-6-phosphate aminotransferase (isomerizing)
MAARPGSRFLAEIEEQPAVLARLVAESRDAARELARRAGRARHVRLIAHGSSDNAASYGVYAFALLANVAAFRESISLLTYYGTAPDLRDSIVVAISQSGRTPDVVEYVRAARRRGALTVALTNDPGSPLAEGSDVVVPLCAGPEEAIAATKTYSASIAALALLAAAVGGTDGEVAAGSRPAPRRSPGRYRRCGTKSRERRRCSRRPGRWSSSAGGSSSRPRGRSR